MEQSESCNWISRNLDAGIWLGKKGDNSSQKAHHRSPQLSQSPIMSYPSLAPFVLKRPWLTKMMMPLANFYVKAAGYRELGLRYVFSVVPPPSPRSCAQTGN